MLNVTSVAPAPAAPACSRGKRPIEILANHIEGNLVCLGNSRTWDSAEASFGHLFPRVPQPNTAEGRRGGQCVLSSPTTPGGPHGPGPF
jgi:hypothetical protein